MIYKLLRMLFKESDNIKNKTVITITGKYGERGYSFTSDDFEKYTFHITDQYFLSHSTFNCTDISQRLRIQGKYNDEKLKSGEMKLTLWTTKELEDVIKNFYVKFIKEIEKKIMDCNNWEEIKELIENIIDNGELKLGKYMKYIDVAKKRKSILVEKKLEKNNCGFRLIKIEDMTDDEISNWCNKQGLPKYICINDIVIIDEKKFIEKYKEHCLKKIKFEYFDNIDEINKFCEDKKIPYPSKQWFKEREKNDNKCVMKGEWKYYTLKDFQNNKNFRLSKENHRFNIYYDEYDIEHKNPKYLLRYNLDEYEIKKCENINIDPYIKIPYIITENNIIKSTIKEEYLINKPENYYWKTQDDWLYLNKGTNKDIVSLKILDETNEIENKKQIYDENVKKFTELCCKKTDKLNLRFGIKEIYLQYEKWCKDNKINSILSQNNFKEEFEKNGYKMEKSKGIDINNKYGKRGYNIMLEYKENKKKIYRVIGNKEKEESHNNLNEIEELEKELNNIIKIKSDKKEIKLESEIPKLLNKIGTENKWKQNICCVKCGRENYNPVWKKGYYAICKLCYKDGMIKENIKN